MTTIIISSPHSMCKPSNERICDTAAGISAKYICAMLADCKNSRFIYLPSTEFRSDHDLNRVSSRDTVYRKILRNIMKISPKGGLLLDVHSFPNYYMEEAGDINFFKKGEIPPEIVLLTGPNDMFQGISLSGVLLNNLKLNGVDCKIISDIKVLDILNEANENNIPGILLEFNEKFSVGGERLAKICKIITDILCDIIKYLSLYK